MFKVNDKVDVYTILPGRHTPMWHAGVIASIPDDKNGYIVKVGGVSQLTKATDIRKVG